VRRPCKCYVLQISERYGIGRLPGCLALNDYDARRTDEREIRIGKLNEGFPSLAVGIGRPRVEPGELVTFVKFHTESVQSQAKRNSEFIKKSYR
jgi:hypothetical protein